LWTADGRHGDEICIDGTGAFKKMTEVLALIPARGGSKGIPRKNIRLFAGFPLIAYSIAAGRQAKLVTRVIVSTEDEEIAAIARHFGAETPFMRPTELAQDQTTDLPVFEHALQWLEDNEGYKPGVLVQLRPTSPIRPRNCVDGAVNLLLDNKGADCVRGVVPAGQNPYKMWRITDEKAPMTPLLEIEGVREPFNVPRQVLPPVYWQTGHVDAIRMSTIRKKHSLTGDKVYPLILDPRYSVDIDNLADWAKYEAVVYSAGLDMVSPGKTRRPMPHGIELIVIDFDGVITDNRVWTDEDGKETVASFRSDSLRLGELKERGIKVIILSSEPNPVVQARASKMGVLAVHGVDIRSKGEALKKLLLEHKIDAEKVVFVGNDLNDLPCFEIAGWTVAVADAYPDVLQAADHILTRSGGDGAVRELCDLLLNKLEERLNGS
jgi:YrbI family 3-deoxy-D-manno-octulosonate 8-phosphate phosphatase